MIRDLYILGLRYDIATGRSIVAHAYARMDERACLRALQVYCHYSYVGEQRDGEAERWRQLRAVA